MAALSMTAAAPGSSVTCFVAPVSAKLSARKEPAGSATAAAPLKELRIQLQINERGSKRPACCKSDGMRFSSADTTVKMRQGASYILTITTTPAVALSVPDAEVKHRQAECQEASMLCCCFPRATEYADMRLLEWSEPMRAALIERGAPASGLAATSSTTAAARTAYELAWDCDMELTRAGVRGELVLEAAIADYGVVSLPVLAKVYNHSDTSAEHGVPLHSITYTLSRSGLTGDIRLLAAAYNK